MTLTSFVVLHVITMWFLYRGITKYPLKGNKSARQWTALAVGGVVWTYLTWNVWTTSLSEYTVMEHTRSSHVLGWIFAAFCAFTLTMEVHEVTKERKWNTWAGWCTIMTSLLGLILFLSDALV